MRVSGCLGISGLGFRVSDFFKKDFGFGVTWRSGLRQVELRRCAAAPCHRKFPCRARLASIHVSKSVLRSCKAQQHQQYSARNHVNKKARRSKESNLKNGSEEVLNQLMHLKSCVPTKACTQKTRSPVTASSRPLVFLAGVLRLGVSGFGLRPRLAVFGRFSFRG